MNKYVLRYLGNFGVGFFGPLTSGNVAETMFNMGLQFTEILFIAAIASSLQLGFTISVDAKKLSEKRNGKKKKK